MTLNIIIFAIGLLFLCYGADWLVKGSSTLAEHFGIKQLVVGLTVVAIGTSAPELVVSVVSVIEKTKDIALGNIIGSNICNIGLILGISPLIFPLVVQTSLLKREVPIMILTSGLLFFMAYNHEISRIEGGILLFGMVAFNLFLIKISLKDKNANKAEDKNTNEPPHNKIFMLKNLMFVAVGIGGLVTGSYMMVKSAVVIAKLMGMSEFTIGLIMVAIGTSLPELATSVAAAIRKEADILIGNVIGSNISNVLLVIGTIGVMQPLRIEQSILQIEFPIMMLFSSILFYFLRSGYILQRIEGFALLLGYIAFVTFTFT